MVQLKGAGCGQNQYPQNNGQDREFTCEFTFGIVTKLTAGTVRRGENLAATIFSSKLRRLLVAFQR
jgi:hypothetical protein